MNGPLTVSVVIPVYNVAPFLEDCVKSVLSQKVPIFEIILVDDGSTDESPMLCDRLAQEHHQIQVIHQKNGGLSDARNTGIGAAKGQYLLFLDSDDRLEHDEVMDDILAVIREKPVDVIMGRFSSFQDEGARPKNDMAFDATRIHNQSRSEVINYLQSTRFIRVAWRNIVHREFLLRHSLRFYPGIYHEDEEWTPRLLSSATTFAYIDRPFYAYRQRPGSISETVSIRHALSKFKVAESLLHHAKTHDDPVCARFLGKSAFIMLVEGTKVRARVEQSSDSAGKKQLDDYVEPRRMDFKQVCSYSPHCKALVRLFGYPMGLNLYIRVLLPTITRLKTAIKR